MGPSACQPPLCKVKTAQPVRLQSLAPVQAGAQMRGPPSLASAPIVVVDVHVPHAPSAVATRAATSGFGFGTLVAPPVAVLVRGRRGALMTRSSMPSSPSIRARASQDKDAKHTSASA